MKQYINKFLLFFLLFSLSSQYAFGADQITDIRCWSAPAHTRVVLDIRGSHSYKKFTLTNPDRLVVDFKDTSISLSQNKIAVDDGFIKQIRFGNFKKDVLRIVFDLVQSTETKISAFSKLPGKTDRLVIEFFHPDLKELAEKKRVKIGSDLKHNKIIVIDPGHGGEDPGAIGPGGTMEKDVVLTFARSLKKIFDEKEGYQAFLTREGDYFIPLRDRIKIAGDYGADLFISVHVDSNHNRKLRGASVYCLSLKGASDEAARCLAEKENASDLIGGISFTQNDDLNFTLLDLALTNTINSSLRLGSLILREIKSVHPIKFDKPKQAGFRVLKTTEIPSVLVELGFVSNPDEERLLKQKKFQVNVSQAIVTASDQFLTR
ncbi:MAG: N-acetylmuramoyl-L-alanine amidase [Proteobacteria bacterium]|nr:N-acetylmuramoyl-L-alanine amidase [Pseudomonadota bacterium]